MNYQSEISHQKVLSLFMKKIKTQKQTNLTIWQKIIKLDKNNRIPLFFQQLQIQNSRIFSDVYDIKEAITIFMNNMALFMKDDRQYQLQCSKLQKQILQIFAENSFIKNGDKQAEKSLQNNSVLKDNKNHFKASQVQLIVIFNELKFKSNYNWEDIAILNQLKIFIKSKLQKRLVLVTNPQKQIYISFDQKQDYRDKYTESYTFDPFFNSIKIKVARNDKHSFSVPFFIDDPKNLNIDFQNNENEQIWKDQNNFNLKDHINLLVDMICDKTQTSWEIRQQLVHGFQTHGIITINDLIKSGDQFIDDFCKNRKKWANQFKNQMAKLIRRKLKTFTGYQDISQPKKDCYRIGTSHKILRYLFYINNNNKGRGLQILKKRIPWLNPTNVINAIQIVKKQIINEALFAEIYLRTFQSFTKIPDLSMILNPQIQPGVLFYGPPGTGKTKLTQEMTELMGFQLITRGLSSAEFMKELVGQMKGTVQSYMYRPNLSKYLMCSMAIDEIQIIVVDRNDKQAKSGEATAMLLSSLGGILNVQNVLVLGSTNHKEKIDPAIERRFTPSYYVGVPSRQQRKNIILNYLKLMKNYPSQFQFLVSITPNFTGAALKILSYDIYNLWERQGKLLQSDLIHIVDAVAKSFKLKFGDQTYSILYKKVQKQLNERFLRKMHKGLLFIEKIDSQKNSIGICYGTKQKQWISKQTQVYHLNRSTLKVRQKINHLNSAFQTMQTYIKQCNQLRLNNQFIIKNIKTLAQLKKQLRNRKQPTLLLLQKQTIDYQQFIFSQQFVTNSYQNLYFVCDLTNYTTKLKTLKSLFDPLGFIDITYKSKFTGRVILDLSQKPQQIDPKMQFQIASNNQNNELICYKKPFLQEKLIRRTKDALPQLVEQLMEKNVDFFQFISAQTLNQNNRYDQQNIKKFITAKFQQARIYQNSAIIIDFDSIVFLSRNITKSLQGNDNQNLSIHNAGIYHFLINFIENFSNQNQDSSKFLITISTDSQLIKMLKKDIKWPLSFDQKKSIYESKKQKELEELKKKKRTCYFCNQVFTQQSNEQQKKCAAHYGYLVDNIKYNFLQIPNSNNQRQYQSQAKFRQYDYNQFSGDSQFQMKYVYACCFQHIGSTPCGVYYHWGGLQDQNPHYTAINAREINFQSMKKKCETLQTNRAKYLKEMQLRRQNQRQKIILKRNVG